MLFFAGWQYPGRRGHASPATRCLGCAGHRATVVRPANRQAPRDTADLEVGQRLATTSTKSAGTLSNVPPCALFPGQPQDRHWYSTIGRVGRTNGSQAANPQDSGEGPLWSFKRSSRAELRNGHFTGRALTGTWSSSRWGSDVGDCHGKGATTVWRIQVGGPTGSQDREACFTITTTNAATRLSCQVFSGWPIPGLVWATEGRAHSMARCNRQRAPLARGAADHGQRPCILTRGSSSVHRPPEWHGTGVGPGARPNGIATAEIECAPCPGPKEGLARSTVFLLKGTLPVQSAPRSRLSLSPAALFRNNSEKVVSIPPPEPSMKANHTLLPSEEVKCHFMS